MKTLMFAMPLALALAAQATPVVSNVQIEQRNSRTVKVTYNLSEDAVVTVDFLTNATAEVWASIGGKNVTHVWGDCNRLVKGAGSHTLYWAPEKSWGAQFADTFSVKAEVKAWAVDAPPNYMVVDLCAEKTIRYYESVEFLPDGDVTNNVYKSDKLVMRKIPAKGVEWRMGSPTGEVGKQKAEDDWNGLETPHYVTFTNDFYLAVFELTRRQGIDRMGFGYWYGDVHYYHPLAGGSTYGGVTYTDMRGKNNLWPSNGHDVDSGTCLYNLRAKTGIDFDLPTEAQWEFACRAGVGAALPNGKEMDAAESSASLDDIAWCVNNAKNTLHDVGSLAPNGFGLYDMLGNIGEYCLDVITPHTGLGSASVIDPIGATGDLYSQRVVRGGSYANKAYYCRSAFRQAYAYIWDQSKNEKKKDNVGFRLWAPAIAK